MAEQLNAEEIASSKEVFDSLDKDGSGTISNDELAKAVNAMGYNPTKAELKGLFDSIDVDGNGEISFSEFLLFVKGIKKYEKREEEIRHYFQLMDTDGNGFISATELRQCAESMGEFLTIEQIEAGIRKVDVDGDGQINYVEFAAVIRSM